MTKRDERRQPHHGEQLPRPRSSLENPADLHDRSRSRVASTSRTTHLPGLRGVAQSGSAPALGAGGRRFKSGRPDSAALPFRSIPGPSDRLRSMARRRFHRRGQLRVGEVVAFRDEERVVAEAAGAARFACDSSAHDTLHDFVAQIVGECGRRSDSAPRAPVRYTLQTLEQPAVVRFVPSPARDPVRRGEASRPHPGPPSRRVHAQARIIG